MAVCAGLAYYTLSLPRILPDRDFTTDSGIHFDIRLYRGGNSARSTPNLVGTQDWPEQRWRCYGTRDESVKIVLRRTPSDKLGNKIRGTAWVDDVSLMPATNRAGKPR